MNNFLNNINIKTRLGICPTEQKVHDLIVITRGATALLTFNIEPKSYTFDYIDQLIFSFKQDSEIRWYSMFTYLKKTDDKSLVPGKIYFKDVKPISSEPNQLQHTGTQVSSEEVAVNPSSAGYYEVIDGTASWRNDIYIIDEHFYRAAGTNYDYITFRLDSKETSQLKLTTPDNNMQFEVAVRLNTEVFANYYGEDSIIIEPQHSIAVVDSLYTHI